MMGWLKKILITWLVFAATSASAETEFLMPFVLAGTSDGDVTSVSAEVRSKLKAGGFTVVGEYSPYGDANIMVVTNDAQKAHATKSDYGAFGAITRVSVTRIGDITEVAYTNPVYMAAAYRMAVDMADIRSQLEAALGAEQDFGSEKNLTAKDLRKYNYTVMMEYFDDLDRLAKYRNQAEAVQAVEDALAAGKGATARVYRVDIPGKDETVFRVALHGADADDCSSDEFVMSRIDKGVPRATAHLPYEIVVTDGIVHALPARFRIAINWPHLPMVASKSGATFMKIMCSPTAIMEALIMATGKHP